ncbi:MAG: hypothetical protein LBQ66_16560 [Planctomycetaceae bacterium]|nr:hypothetical protein [Planctomycetaceae bacterium]
MFFWSFTPSVETNYCSDGGRFELSFPLSSLGTSMGIQPENGELRIKSELKKSIPIQISAQLPDVLDISFDNYDKLKINIACEIYTTDGQLLFKDIESNILARDQVVLSRRGNGIEVVFLRNIIITIYSNKNNTKNKSIIATSMKSDNGQLIEISTTETNADVIEIYGNIKITMSGAASTVHNNISITSSSSESLHHIDERRYFGKYIIISETNENKY